MVLIISSMSGSSRDKFRIFTWPDRSAISSAALMSRLLNSKHTRAPSFLTTSARGHAVPPLQHQPLFLCRKKQKFGAIIAYFAEKGSFFWQFPRFLLKSVRSRCPSPSPAGDENPGNFQNPLDETAKRVYNAAKSIVSQTWMRRVSLCVISREPGQLRTGNDNAAEHGLGVARPKPGKTRRQSRDGGARYRAMLSAGRACPQQMRSHTAR